MTVYVKGAPIEIPCGPGGPDGNPIGSVISLVGMKAPAGYLICDGSEHKIETYPDLANYFSEQFGAVDHFGGDGTTTFAVPDFRNLFLRGYHGDDEQLSGEIGMEQNATLIPFFQNTYAHITVPSYHDSYVSPRNMDSVSVRGGGFKGQDVYNYDYLDMEHDPNQSEFTTRPVNAAVLYCIKAVESGQSQSSELYFTDGWMVQKFSNGFAQCFLKKRYIVAEDEWAAYGTGFNSKQLTSTPYPIPLVESFETLSVFPNKGVGIHHANTNHEGQTAVYQIMRMTKPTSALTYDLEYHVSGLWKPIESQASIPMIIPEIIPAFGTAAASMTSGIFCEGTNDPS